MRLAGLKSGKMLCVARDTWRVVCVRRDVTLINCYLRTSGVTVRSGFTILADGR